VNLNGGHPASDDELMAQQRSSRPAQADQRPWTFAGFWPAMFLPLFLMSNGNASRFETAGVSCMRRAGTAIEIAFSHASRLGLGDGPAQTWHSDN
jgi:hypothetical protein